MVTVGTPTFWKHSSTMPLLSKWSTSSRACQPPHVLQASLQDVAQTEALRQVSKPLPLGEG